jgi:hypothetical protein
MLYDGIGKGPWYMPRHQAVEDLKQDSAIMEKRQRLGAGRPTKTAKGTLQIGSRLMQGHGNIEFRAAARGMGYDVPAASRSALAMSALMSASAYFCLLPPRPDATCSSIASLTVLLCAALVLEDMYAAPLCLPIFAWRISVDSRLTAFLWRPLVVPLLLRLL